ncbi:MAG: hypothetical protein IKL10_06770 [Clostridia bacterium]|nr:hypothetical protein [Clostridia bacterium]
MLVIGEAEVLEAGRILASYKSAKASLDMRVIENEKWFRLRHWEQLRPVGKPERRHSAWLFNSIVNKHADFMDSLPECTVLPREAGDTMEAERLTSVLPVILERNNWQEIYSEGAYRKLKTGTAVYSVLWNSSSDSGLGDIDIKSVDILNLFWEPGIRDIQKSRNLFYVDLVDNDLLIEEYPFLEGTLGGSNEILSYTYDGNIDTSGKSAVVDWYYKKRVSGRTVLHYCKFVNSTLLYSSENDPLYTLRGWYDHGLYPFVFDPLFKEEGTPVGFGFIDVMKDAQEEIDILGNEIIRNARLGARKRYFTRVEGAVNEEEFADFNKDFVHVSGSSIGEESIREIGFSPLSPVYITVLNNKITELKETSGNRDFTQGGTSGGVTSGAAITALQEAGNKLSRDMISATYNAFSGICTLCIELMRQFYTVPRSMRILGTDGGFNYSLYDNSVLKGEYIEGEFGLRGVHRLPVFDVKVKAHRQNTFSRAAQNTDALNFFSMGFFDPEKAVQALACMELIDIENKEKIKSMIKKNAAQILA